MRGVIHAVVGLLVGAIAVASIGCAGGSAPGATASATGVPVVTATGSATATVTASPEPPSGTPAGPPASGSATDVSGSVGPGVTVTPLPPGATPSPVPPIPTSTATPAPTPPVPAAAGPGVYGLLTVGPTCPVQRVDQPCPDRAYAGTLVFEDATGREVARVTAGDDGWYQVPIPPGTYHVIPMAADGGFLPRAAPADVTVAGQAWSRLDIAYDSGIR